MHWFPGPNLVLIFCVGSLVLAWSSDLLCFVPPADPVHGGREGAEAAADGPGRGDEEQRLPLHRPVLRGALQRGALTARTRLLQPPVHMHYYPAIHTMLSSSAVP